MNIHAAAFRNMEKAFIELRCRELEHLGTLITYPWIGDSQILASFLSPKADPSLFLPDSVTGKMLKKAVPSMLKRDVSRGCGLGVEKGGVGLCRDKRGDTSAGRYYGAVWIIMQ